MKRTLFYLLCISITFTNCSSDGDGDGDGQGNCPNPINIETYTNSSNSVDLYWYVEDDGEGSEQSISNILSYDLEYGPTGFNIGSGTRISTSNYNYTVSNLMAETQYDVYVRSKCSDNSTSEFFGPITFMTQEACVTPTNLYFSSSAITSCSFNFDWYDNGETSWEIEYGESGFSIGTGNTVNTSDNEATIDGLSPNTTYEVYVRANCGSQGYSQYSEALVVTTEPLSSSLVGEWTIVMQDAYGDGWQGDGLKITVNGNIGYATIPDGTASTYGVATFDLPSNVYEFTIEFTGDMYPEEVSYEIYDPNDQLRTSGSNPSVGVVFSLDDICY